MKFRFPFLLLLLLSPALALAQSWWGLYNATNVTVQVETSEAPDGSGPWTVRSIAPNQTSSIPLTTAAGKTASLRISTPRGYNNFRAEVGQRYEISWNGQSGSWNLRRLSPTAQPLPPGPPAAAAPSTGGGYGEFSDLVQLAVDGNNLYYLRRNGNVLLDSGSGPQVYDNGTGSKQIAVDKGICYVLKNNGDIWRKKQGGRWEKIDDSDSANQLIAMRGGLYVLRKNGNIWNYDGNQWTMIDAGQGTKQVDGDRLGNLYALKSNGNIWKYDGRWNKIDNGTGTRQIEAARGVVYALKDSGVIWRYDSQWSKIANETSVFSMHASGEHLFIVKKDGVIWKYDGSWHKLLQEQVRSATVAHGNLYILRPNGTVRVVAGY